MQRKNFLFCGPSLQTRRETVNFPFEQLPPTKDIPGRKRSEYDDVAMVGEKRHLVYISMGTLYQLNPAFFKACATWLIVVLCDLLLTAPIDLLPSIP